MKKFLILLVTIGFFSLPILNAQISDNTTTPMSNSKDSDKVDKGGFKVKGGITLSTVGFDNEDAVTQKNRFRVGGTAGLSYEIAAEKVFGFELGLLYDLRGTKEETKFIGGIEIIQRNYLHYLSIPADFKFYIGDNFNVHFGPYAAVLLGGKTKYTKYDNLGEILDEKEYKITGEGAQDLSGNDYLKRMDAGLQFGLEFITDGGFGVGSNFSKGLVDITNDDHIYGKGNARTTEINIYMLFRF